MAEITETVPFNYDELYTSVQEKFDALGYDTEPGSNTSQLITAMTYMVSMLNVNTAVNINETLLPLATKRNNVLQDARVVGYEIQHKQSYTYLLTITLTAGDHTIPKFTKFTEGGKDYYYMGNQLDFEGVSEGAEIQLLVVEGLLHLYIDFPDSLVVITGTFTNTTGDVVPQYFVDIPFVDVEENGIEIFVTYYDDFGNLITREKWERSTTFIMDSDNTLDQEWIRLDNIDFNTPRIYFELSGTGQSVKVGSIIEMNALTTSGVDGAMTNPSDPTGITFDLDGLTIVDVDLVTEGADEESLESIQENAPKFNNTANRAVTKLDYEAICDRQVTVRDTMVWGGDDEFPKAPGHIFFSFLPSNYSRVFTADSFNFNYTLDNNTYLDWDYSLDPVGDEEAYDAQEDAANVFYDNAFLQDGEIRSSSYTEDGQLIQPGVWDVLDAYKILTLEFHNRHPIYLDFEYNISILKYDITESNADLQQSIFDTIDNFFTGTQDSIKMEDYETEYFDSSITKRIDAVLTDASGLTSSLTTRLMITKKNISQENINADYRDLYFSLAVPFESYFDVDGYLLYDTLPVIDTLDFIQYEAETGGDIYVDWTDIQDDIDNLITQSTDTIISAPVRAKQAETVIISGTPTEVFLVDTLIIPDDPTQLDADVPVYTFNQTVITLEGVVLDYITDWTFDDTDLTLITLVSAAVDADTLIVSQNQLVGYYQLFNSFRKNIIVQLYVDATGYTESGVTNQYDINTPKSYLTTTDNFYGYTQDIYYLTTEGYVVEDPSDADAITGPVIKEISPSSYTSSPIKMDLFRNNRYFNLDYNTSNFSILNNTIPRLNTVTFEQGV